MSEPVAAQHGLRRAGLEADKKRAWRHGGGSRQQSFRHRVHDSR